MASGPGATQPPAETTAPDGAAAGLKAKLAAAPGDEERKGDGGHLGRFLVLGGLLVVALGGGGYGFWRWWPDRGF